MSNRDGGLIPSKFIAMPYKVVQIDGRGVSGSDNAIIAP